MIVDREEINGGELEFGKSYTYNVVLKNPYDEDIKIKAIRKSCTCTEATLEGDSSLKKGETSIVKIVITPGSTGLFSRQVLVEFFRLGIGEFVDTIKLKATVK